MEAGRIRVVQLRNRKFEIKSLKKMFLKCFERVDFQPLYHSRLVPRKYYTLKKLKFLIFNPDLQEHRLEASDLRLPQKVLNMKNSAGFDLSNNIHLRICNVENNYKNKTWIHKRSISKTGNNSGNINKPLYVQDNSKDNITSKMFEFLFKKQEISSFWGTVNFLQRTHLPFNVEVPIFEYTKFDVKKVKYPDLFKRGDLEAKCLIGQIPTFLVDYVDGGEEVRFMNQLRTESEERYMAYINYKIFKTCKLFSGVALTKFQSIFTKNSLGNLYLCDVKIYNLKIDNNLDIGPSKKLDLLQVKRQQHRFIYQKYRQKTVNDNVKDVKSKIDKLRSKQQKSYSDAEKIKDINKWDIKEGLYQPNIKMMAWNKSFGTKREKNRIFNNLKIEFDSTVQEELKTLKGANAIKNQTLLTGLDEWYNKLHPEIGKKISLKSMVNLRNQKFNKLLKYYLKNVLNIDFNRRNKIGTSILRTSKDKKKQDFKNFLHQSYIPDQFLSKGGRPDTSQINKNYNIGGDGNTEKESIRNKWSRRTESCKSSRKFNDDAWISRQGRSYRPKSCIMTSISTMSTEPNQKASRSKFDVMMSSMIKKQARKPRGVTIRKNNIPLNSESSNIDKLISDRERNTRQIKTSLKGQRSKRAHSSLDPVLRERYLNRKEKDIFSLSSGFHKQKKIRQLSESKKLRRAEINKETIFLKGEEKG